MTSSPQRGIGNILFPWRFLLFIAVTVIATALCVVAIGWMWGSMAGFDLGAAIFLASCAPLMRDEAAQMRKDAKKNDANRALLLGISAIVMLVVMLAVASALRTAGSPKPIEIALILVTLALSWLFSNVVYAMHYAHLFYTGDGTGQDCAGLEFPKTAEPSYWDFIYYSFCVGMTFQTSDTEVQTERLRRITTFHSLAAFVFNIGVIAFTINVIGGK